MIKKLGIVIIGIITLSIMSCQSKKSTSNSESKFFTDSIYSDYLDEYRKHNVYLPKGFDDTKTYPIIYSTDGNKITENSFYKRTLDSLINNKIIDPVILIKSYSNNKIADSSGTLGNGDTMYLTLRYFEYVDQYSEGNNNPELANRFDNHMRYFNTELLSSVEQKFNQKLTKEDRYFYGVSNGAGFGLYLLNKYPNTIGTYLCFSTFGGDVQSSAWEKNIDYPKLYLQYGSKEPSFLKEDAEFLKSKYEKLDLFADIHEFEGGHDYKKWNEKFIEIISNILATE
ncbi:alpha/beta hydrolase [Psychroserpens sp. Hel_I_66]|uniref:alpha/beta hydrolase n=1 Tax=Psychroserpens sp. Hel_I_66 TaxID=1250004 RepID=UPI000647C9E9|nr:alpha/beta hydrolase-fold protein [Psychroserpens sp. Hel_I_66]